MRKDKLVPLTGVVDEETYHKIIKEDWTHWKRNLLADLLNEYVQSDEHCGRTDDETIYRLQEEILS